MCAILSFSRSTDTLSLTHSPSSLLPCPHANAFLWLREHMNTRFWVRVSVHVGSLTHTSLPTHDARAHGAHPNPDSHLIVHRTQALLNKRSLRLFPIFSFRVTMYEGRGETMSECTRKRFLLQLTHSPVLAPVIASLPPSLAASRFGSGSDAPTGAVS